MSDNTQDDPDDGDNNTTNNANNTSNNSNKNNNNNKNNINYEVIKKRRDPYATLNLPQTATAEDIQRSYKRLSRAFHPDKQQQHSSSSQSVPSSPRNDTTDGIDKTEVVAVVVPPTTPETAQNIFIKFKESHDILVDPALRLAYDLYGHKGVDYLKLSMSVGRGSSYSKAGGTTGSDATVYQKISILVEEDGSGSAGGFGEDTLRMAKEILDEAFQYQRFKGKDGIASSSSSPMYAAPQASGGIELKCTTLHTSILGEGVEPMGLDVEKTKINFSVTTPIPLPPLLVPVPVLNNNNDDNDKQQKSNTNNTSPSSSSKCNLTIGGSTILQPNAKSASNTSLSLDYEPTPGTEICLTCDVASNFATNNANANNPNNLPHQQRQPPKVSIGTSRVMSNRTYVTTNLSTIPNSKDAAFSFTTHRSLFDNSVQGACALGFGIPSMDLHYGLISITKQPPTPPTNTDDNDTKSSSSSHTRIPIPKVTLKANLGLEATPIHLLLEHTHSPTHTTTIDYGFGRQSLIDLRILSKRTLTRYCTISTGLHHSTTSGLTWMIALSRGSMKLSIPISVVGGMSGVDAIVGEQMMYWSKAMYMALWTVSVDTGIGEYLDLRSDVFRNRMYDAMGGGGGETDAATNGDALSIRRRRRRQQEREDGLLEREKMEADAMQQIRLMSKPALEKRRVEEGRKGLVILKGTYGVMLNDGGNGGNTGYSIDVTIALQFWVANSALHLPASGSKSSMLGFYDLRSSGGVSGGGGDSANGDILSNLFNGGTTINDSIWKTCAGLWQRFRYGDAQKKEEEEQQRRHIPTLTVRYRYRDDAYEITVLDHEALSLPSEMAMKLGGVYVC